jgi:hypothetical protein
MSSSAGASRGLHGLRGPHTARLVASAVRVLPGRVHDHSGLKAPFAWPQEPSFFFARYWIAEGDAEAAMASVIAIGGPNRLECDERKAALHRLWGTALHLVAQADRFQLLERCLEQYRGYFLGGSGTDHVHSGVPKTVRKLLRLAVLRRGDDLALVERLFSLTGHPDASFFPALVAAHAEHVYRAGLSADATVLPSPCLATQAWAAEAQSSMTRIYQVAGWLWKNCWEPDAPPGATFSLPLDPELIARSGLTLANRKEKLMMNNEELTSVMGYLIFAVLVDPDAAVSAAEKKVRVEGLLGLVEGMGVELETPLPHLRAFLLHASMPSASREQQAEAKVQLEMAFREWSAAGDYDGVSLAFRFFVEHGPSKSAAASADKLIKLYGVLMNTASRQRRVLTQRPDMVSYALLLGLTEGPFSGKTLKHAETHLAGVGLAMRTGPYGAGARRPVDHVFFDAYEYASERGMALGSQEDVDAEGCVEQVLCAFTADVAAFGSSTCSLHSLFFSRLTAKQEKAVRKLAQAHGLFVKIDYDDRGLRVLWTHSTETVPLRMERAYDACLALLHQYAEQGEAVRAETLWCAMKAGKGLAQFPELARVPVSELGLVKCDARMHAARIRVHALCRDLDRFEKSVKDTVTGVAFFTVHLRNTILYGLQGFWALQAIAWKVGPILSRDLLWRPHRNLTRYERLRFNRLVNLVGKRAYTAKKKTPKNSGGR